MLLKKKTSVLLAAALAAPLMTTSAFGVDVVENGDFSYAHQGTKTGTQGILIDGQDVNLNTLNDGWLNWAHSGNSFARVWNPSTTNTWSAAGNEWYDTSFGGTGNSADAGDQFVVVRTSSWDYRPSSSINGADDLTKEFTDVNGNRLWTANDSGVSEDAGIRYEWRADDGGTPDHVRDAVAPTDPFTYVQEYSDTVNKLTTDWQGTAVRNHEGVAQVADVFDSTAKYTLTVDVGRLAANGLNAGAYVSPGADNDYTTAGDNGAGTSSRVYYDVAPSTAPNAGAAVEADWDGYEVGLFAGGDTDYANGSYNSWAYGQEASDADPGYMEEIASDDTQAGGLAADTWGAVTIGYTPSVGSSLHDMNGEALMIRLLALENANHQVTSHVAFDNVVLTKIMAGDADGNDLVDLNDGGTLVANFGATTGQTWETADFTGDGAVDLNDAGLLVGNFGFGAEPDTAGVAGDAQWTYDAIVAGLSTQITVDAVSMAFLATEALDGATLELLTQAVPFSTGQFGPGALVGEFMTSNFITGSETIQVNVDSAGLYTFNARWNNVGGEEQSQTFQIQFGEVPEPSSLALLGLGSLLMARRRRNA